MSFTISNFCGLSGLLIELVKNGIKAKTNMRIDIKIYLFDECKDFDLR